MKLLTHQQAHWLETLSEFNYMVCYCPGWLGGKPDALTHQRDVYPKGGEGSFALTNSQNFQTIFKDGQLATSLQSTSAYDSLAHSIHTIDLDSMFSDIHTGITEDPAL